MTDQLISFETAVLAKEKGFNLHSIPKCFAKENNSGNLLSEMWADSLTDDVTLIAYQPTQSLLQKWLREKHEIFVDININDFGHDWYICETYKDVYKRKYTIMPGGASIWSWHAYEDCLEKGLFEALKLIKS